MLIGQSGSKDYVVPQVYSSTDISLKHFGLSFAFDTSAMASELFNEVCSSFSPPAEEKVLPLPYKYLHSL